MSEAVVGLGSNLGDKSRYLLEAVQALSRLPGTKIKGISSIYSSRPEDGKPDQEDYHNMAVKLETGMSPMALLGACLGIEAAMGRVRAGHLLRAPSEGDRHHRRAQIVAAH